MTAGLIIIFILNLFISFVNAYGAGRTWSITRRDGGFAHLLNWCAAIMSACGFTWCYTIILVLGADAFHLLTPHNVKLAFELGYVIIIPAVLGTGLIITINSWVEFWRRPSLMGGATAAWNTYAQISNTLDAVTFFPSALGDITDSFKSDKDDEDNGGKGLILVVMLVLLALVGGVLTTRYIILKTAASNLS